MAPELGKLSAQLEANVTKAFQGEAFAAVKEEHGKYFEALQRHPRTMVGTEVPSVQGEGMETLRNTEDAKEWQEAVKSILTQEINARTETKVEESQQFLETVHASIDLFKTNKDLIPGTKGFNRGLADRFAAMAKPYEVRVDNKLQGYSIPVQPLIDQLRTQLAAQTPAAAPATSRAIPPEEPPQAGIASKAGEAGEPKEDFSALFNTIGSVNMQI